jgi:hypothetical protein
VRLAWALFLMALLAVIALAKQRGGVSVYDALACRAITENVQPDHRREAAIACLCDFGYEDVCSMAATRE